MPPTTLIDNEYATLWYHPDTKIVHHKFHKPIKGQAFRDVLLQGVATFEQQGAQKWLSDDRANSALDEDDATWAMTEWSVRVVKAGWKFWAIVMPDVTVGKINMKRFISLYAYQGVKVQLFEDPNEALTWLQKADKRKRA